MKRGGAGLRGINPPGRDGLYLSTMFRFLCVAALCSGALPVAAQNIEQGLKLAVVNCSRCHALGESDASAFPDAPPFRTIHEFYAPGELERAFVEGFVVAHPAMPQWTMSPQQARDIAAFIMSFGPAKPE